MLSELDNDQRALADYMSEISEDAFSASWMEGLEFELWQAVNSGPQIYGRLHLEASHLDRLASLSTQCGGWIFWHPTNEETYVGLKHWEKIYRAETAS